MRELNEVEVEMCAGGMVWEGNRQSDNVEDYTGTFVRNSLTGNIIWGASIMRVYYSVFSQ